MCAIIDHNVTFEVFGRKQTEAGKEFRKWLDDGQGVLVVGGKNLRELTQNNNFRNWFVESRRLVDRLRQIDKAKIEAEEERLRVDGRLTSNDGHVVALAIVSGARLLYTNDRKLTQDFENAEVVVNTTGEVFETRESKRFTSHHQDLLNASVLSQIKRGEYAQEFLLSARRDDEQWRAPREEEQRSRRRKGPAYSPRFI